jgi:hypothetical protein
MTDSQRFVLLLARLKALPVLGEFTDWDGDTEPEDNHWRRPLPLARRPWIRFEADTRHYDYDDVQALIAEFSQQGPPEAQSHVRE